MKGIQGKYRACVRSRTQREIKGMGKGCKKRRRYRDKKDGYNWTEDAQQGKYGRRTGATEQIGTEKWRGRQGLQKEKTPEQRAHTGKARKMHKKPAHEKHLIYIKVKTGKAGKGRSTHRLTEDKRNNYPEEKTGLGRPKTEGKRRTPDKKTARTENGKDQASPETKRYLTATVHIRPATAAPTSPHLQHHGCPADKGGFSRADYGNDDTGRTRQARHGKSEYPYLQDKSP